MRRRAWAAFAALALWLAVGLLGRATDQAWLNGLAGLLLVTAAVLGLTLLPWRRPTGRARPPMRGLFSPVGEGQRWCDRCGTVTQAKEPCARCAAPPPRARRTRRKTEGRDRPGP